MMLKKIYRKRPFFWNTLKHGLIPLLFYFVVFCLLTYPLILKFFTHFFADDLDGLQNVWNLWWVNSVVLHPNLYPSIWQTNMLHWPYGTTLIGQTLNPFNGFLAVFLLRFLSITATYNAITIFAFVMGGLTMYWLSYLLTKSFWGSIIAGFIFTFSDYHFMHAHGHLQLVSLEWIPLFILCWYLLITKPRTVTAIGAAIVLWMVILCDYYYFFYCVLIAILILLWYAIINKNIRFIVRKDYIVPLASFVVIVLLLISPIIGTLLISNYRDPLISPHDPVSYSLDLLALIIPGGGWLFHQWTQFYWSKLPGGISESSVCLGLSVFVLLGYVWIKRTALELVIKQQIYLWFMAIGFFFVLALGPALHIAGRVIWNKGMPYTLLVDVLPFLKLSGLPVRMTVMIILGASILSAIGLRELFRQFPQKWLFTFGLLGILLFEALPTPLAATRIEVPEYVTTLAGLPNDGGVVDMVTTGISLPLFYQTIHRKPLVLGYISRVPTSVNEKDVMLVETIRNRDYGKLWDTYHIRYIITHDTIQAQDVQPYMSIKTVYDRNSIRIYRIGCECEDLK
jgi:hypothetical protein